MKLVPDTFDLPCLGNNGLVIEDVGMGYSGAKSVSFCGKKNIPAFVSSDVKFEIHLTIDDPGPVNLIVFNPMALGCNNFFTKLFRVIFLSTFNNSNFSLLVENS